MTVESWANFCGQAQPSAGVGTLPPAKTTTRTGDVLRAGEYEIHSLWRFGSDRVVYLAYDRAIDRSVVVDVFSNNSILPNLVDEGERVSRSARWPVLLRHSRQTFLGS